MSNKYSSEAKRIIRRIKDFDKEKFESWYEENVNVVGGRHVLEFISIEEKVFEGGN